MKCTLRAAVLRLSVAAVAQLVLGVSPLFSQALGTLRVTVVDQTGAVIIGASVTVKPDGSASTATASGDVKTDANGVATAPGLRPGTYSIQAQFPGFETKAVNGVRIRAGDNRQLIVLSLSRLEASVTVSDNGQEGASDRRPSFGTTLTREEIEALSDDPAILQQQLQEMAGPGAVIKIDGFEGGALPAKAQIRSIRISRDQFAAESHSAGGNSVELITQPGLGPIRYNVFSQLRSSSFTGRSPFVPVKGEDGNFGGGFGLNGALIKDKSSFNFFLFRSSSYDTPNLNAVYPDNHISTALRLRAPRGALNVNGQVDYALTLDQTLRVAYNLTRNTAENLGVGGYDDPTRAYSTESNVHNVRIQHYGPIGRRMFSRSRLQFFVSDFESVSAVDAMTIRVSDSFTTGGAQQSGGPHSRTVNIGSDLDYVRGRHSWRAGVLVEGGWYRSDASFNYLGTYTFNNLARFEANDPSNFTRRVGDPELSYQNWQAAVYLQDDIRLRRNLTISPGIRYEVQTHVGDRANVGPRFGATWAPFPGGQTTLRASAGIFYDWLATNVYEQSVRVDGTHQLEENIPDPPFPAPDLGPAVVGPANRYLLDSAYQAPRISRVSAGIDQTLFKVTRIAASYSYLKGSRQARGLNLNPPVDGVRPDPSYGNIVEAVADAASRQHQLQVDATINPGALAPAFNGPLISWKRTTGFVNYTMASLRNNTDGAFVVSPSGDIQNDWGPASTDVLHRANLNFNNQIVRNVLLALNVNTTSGAVYSALTGRDDNGDGVFNDRPGNVGRNTLRTVANFNINFFGGYVFAFGPKVVLPPAVGVFGGGGGAAQVRSFDQGSAKYRLQVYMTAQNLTNRANYTNYSGTITSQFFGQPTSVTPMRRIEFGLGLNF